MAPNTPERRYHAVLCFRHLMNANHVSPRELGVLMGVTVALGSLMSILGPLWAGAVYDHVMRGAPYWMGAVVFMLAARLLARPISWRRIRWSS